MQNTAIVDHDEISRLDTKPVLDPFAFDHSRQQLVGLGAHRQTIAGACEVDRGMIIEDDSSKRSIDTGLKHGDETSITAGTFTDEKHGPAREFRGSDR